MKGLLLLAVLCALLNSNAAAGPWPLYGSVGVDYSATNSVASTDSGVSGGFPPSGIPLNGLPFDDEDVGWSAAAGYQFVDWFAVELGYEDFGRFYSSANFGVSANGQSLDVPAIGAEGIFLKAQFQYPLTEWLRATWHAGVVRAEFDARGSTLIVIAPPIFPFPPLQSVEVPFADPDRETGYFLGFGLSWRANKHLEVELAYSRKELEVLLLDTVGLRVIARL